MGFWAHVPCLSLISWIWYCLGEGPQLPSPYPLLFYVCRPLGRVPTMPLHCFCYIIISPLFLVIHGLTSYCSCHANPLSTSLPLLGFIGQHSCCACPFHSLGFLGPFTPLYFFYSHGLFAKSFRLFWPNYHIFISYYFSNTLILPMGLLLHSLGFLSPFTSSLPLIILVGLLAIIPAILAY